MKAKSISYWTFSSLVMAVFGFYFSAIFQDMAFWAGEKGGIPTTLLLYWVVAGLSYVFTLMSIIFICIRHVGKLIRRF
jgi:hypothetical protein